VCIYICKIIIHSAPTYIMYMYTFILDAINRLTILCIHYKQHLELKTLKYFANLTSWNRYFFMEYRRICYKLIIRAHLESEHLPLPLAASLMTRAGQPVTRMRSANSKPQPSNQFPTGTIKPRLLHIWEEKTSVTSTALFQMIKTWRIREIRKQLTRF